MRPSGGDYPYHRGRHLSVALQIDTFADESGIEPDQGYCVVAGYTSNPAHWPKFQEAWNAEVTEQGFNRFKASDFFTLGRAKRYRRGEYEKARWRRIDERADAHLDRLLSIVETPEVVPSASAVSWADFKKFHPDEQQILAVGSPRRSPYYLVMFGILASLVANSDNLPVDVKMNLVMERQDVLRDHAIDAFNTAVQDLVRQGFVGAERLGRISYVSPFDEPQLQAADLLCYTFRRTLTDGPRCPDQIRRAYARASRGIEFTTWHEPQLRKLLTDYRKLPRPR